jgi:hypothetical protein
MPINALRSRWNQDVIADNAYEKQRGDASGDFTFMERQALKRDDGKGVSNEELGKLLKQVYGDASEATYKKAIEEFDLSDLNPKRQKSFLYEKLQEQANQSQSADRVWY